MRIKIKEIKVSKDRIRKDFGNIDELAGSLARIGQLQAIVLDNDNFLIAGGRRLAAAIHNGWEDIEAVRLGSLAPALKKEMELEENLRRKDLTWVEEVKALRALHEMKQERYEGFPGEAKHGIEATAEELERSTGSISMDIALARALDEFPTLADEATKSSAWKRYKRERETKIRSEQARRTRPVEETNNEEIEKILAKSESKAGEAPSQSNAETARQPIRRATWKGKGQLYLADSRDVLRLSPENSIDCIVTDPPFGLGMFKEGDATGGSRLAANAGHMYDDDPAKIMDMLDQVMGYAARMLKPDGHAYVFFHMTKYEETFLILRKHFGTCEETPLIWVKNTPGIGDPNRSWVYSYEPCFFINRGRSLIKPQAFNYLRYDTVPPNQKIHPTQKPDALLRHIISASCVEGETILDPFAGSGSTLVAASQVGCRFIGVEREEKFHRIACDRIAEEIAAHEEVTNGQAATGS